MAKQKYKKKINKVFSGIGVIIIALIVSLFTLDKTQIIDYNSIMTSLGLRDESVSKDNVSVHYINVGQGDCELIISGGKVVLIDAGESEYGQTVINYIKQQNINRIDYIIASHPHSDHIGGLSAVIDNFDVGAIYMPKVKKDLVPTSSTYAKLLQSISKKGLKISTAEFGQKLQLNDSYLLLYPPQKDYDDLNDYSIVCKLVHGKNKFLFTGDAQAQEENDLMDRKVDLKADVLKVGHHGSSTSSKKDFLKKVDPDMCIISVGDNNSYNHPNSNTVKRLKEYTDKVFRTDLVGTVVVKSDGSKIKYTLEKEE